MRLAVTGTPGTGKTTATEALVAGKGTVSIDMSVIHLNDLIRERNLWTERDADRETLVADLDAVRDVLDCRSGIIESHLAHRMEADRVVVLRCRPDVLERRLLERGDSAAKAEENRESEALDVILSEAVDRHGRERVYEIDTTDRSPADVADAIARVVTGDREPSAGDRDYLGYV